MNVTVTVDDRQMTALLHRLGDRTLLSDAVMDAAEQGARMVSDVPRDTGELASSVRATAGRNPSPNSALIVADAPYAAFVFGGTRYMPATRPSLNTGTLTTILANNVKRTVFR